ncbi:MAG: hypothetical protein A4E26_00884 [Methanobacterium sp. PtaU1.Bin097]|nr:MAG: hypothetical protein A4E26_00884 [Methanobacterium sp. PtaU1.Bin097]
MSHIFTDYWLYSIVDLRHSLIIDDHIHKLEMRNSFIIDDYIQLYECLLYIINLIGVHVTRGCTY